MCAAKTEKVNIGSRLWEARKSLDLTQGELGERVGRTGVDQTTIGRWERNGEVPAEKLDALAEALDVSPEWLETGEEPSEDNSPAPPDYVSSDDRLVDWLRAVTGAGYRDALQVTMLALPQFRDPETWVISVTPEAVAERTRRDLEKIDGHWDDVLSSPLVERVGPAEYTLKLRFPDEDGAA